MYEAEKKSRDPFVSKTQDKRLSSLSHDPAKGNAGRGGKRIPSLDTEAPRQGHPKVASRQGGVSNSRVPGKEPCESVLFAATGLSMSLGSRRGVDHPIRFQTSRKNGVPPPFLGVTNQPKTIRIGAVTRSSLLTSYRKYFLCKTFDVAVFSSVPK